MDIQICNCKNIDLGTIHIEENRLNIKYAVNGTGKSTIAQAIDFQINNRNKNVLIPYKYLSESPLSEEHSPSATFDNPVSKIAIFNEDYVNQYIFLPSELVANSFEVFIRTPDYELQMQKIQNLVKDINSMFAQNQDLNDLIDELYLFISGFGKAANGYSKTGAIGKGIDRGNKIQNIPPQLIDYKPYIQSDKTATWLTWQYKGEEFLDVAEKCPYCANVLSTENKQKVRLVATEYDSKYVTELQKMLHVFQSLNDYFTEEVKNKISNLSSLQTEYNKEQINYLKQIKDQVEILYSRLFNIKNLNFNSLKNIDTVIEYLKNQKLDLSLLGYINSDFTQSKIIPINAELDKIITQAGQLQGAVARQKNLIATTIQKYQNEINGFLESAGYNYNVSIIEDAQQAKYNLVLKSNELEKEIANVKEHLSYGERNAFALVLFMYKTLKENPNLIVLDDPISSFDKNKKYAIVEKLFKGSGTFQGKTVIMLTHDFDPVVDLIHTPSIKCRFQPQPVAAFIENVNGVLTEKTIQAQDIKSFIELSNYNIANSQDEINKLIYLRRYLEAIGNKDLEWELLSNIFHTDREQPTIQSDQNRLMTASEIAQASERISAKIPGFDYTRIYARAHNTAEMIDLYEHTANGYEKVQLYRLINNGRISDSIFKKFVDEAYHIENDSLFQLNPAEFPTIPNYIIALCDNGIQLIKSQLN